MWLCYFQANAAWAFVFGSPLALHGFPMFFQARKDAVAAAASLGLDVSRAGHTTVKPRDVHGAVL